MQTVFFDLRRPVLEELYQHHVEGARLHPVLVQLDAALEDMVTAASESLPPYLARSLLQAITMALQRILLDGGPYRCAALCCAVLVRSAAVLCCAVLGCVVLSQGAAVLCCVGSKCRCAVLCCIGSKYGCAGCDVLCCFNVQLCCAVWV